MQRHSSRIRFDVTPGSPGWSTGDDEDAWRLEADSEEEGETGSFATGLPMHHARGKAGPFIAQAEERCESAPTREQRDAWASRDAMGKEVRCVDRPVPSCR